jgi:hypothetical protein
LNDVSTTTNLASPRMWRYIENALAFMFRQMSFVVPATLGVGWILALQSLTILSSCGGDKDHQLAARKSDAVLLQGTFVRVFGNGRYCDRWTFEPSGIYRRSLTDRLQRTTTGEVAMYVSDSAGFYAIKRDMLTLTKSEGATEAYGFEFRPAPKNPELVLWKGSGVDGTLTSDPAQVAMCPGHKRFGDTGAFDQT